MSVMRGHATSIFAGFATALICLPEYLGLGAMIGSAAGGGANAAGLAALLVVISVVLTSMPVRPQKAVLSGPRAASVSVMVFMLSWLAPSAPSLGMVFLAAPIMIFIAALLGFVSSHQPIIGWIQKIPPVVSHTFLFATGVGIISEALRKQYAPCIEVAPVAAPALLILLALLTVGAIVLKQHYETIVWVSLLPLGVIGIAWGLDMLLIGSGSQGACRPLGASGIEWSAWLDHLSGWRRAFASAAWSQIFMLKLLAAGLVLGVVMALENHMCINSLKPPAKEPLAEEPPAKVQAIEVSYLPDESLLRRNTSQNILSGALAGMPASMSTARTALLHQFEGKGRLAVWSHGLFLVLMLSLGQAWIAKFPAMAVCAALLLAGLLMIDRPKLAEDFWNQALKSEGHLHLDLWIFAICVLLGALLVNGNWVAMLIAILMKLLINKVNSNQKVA
jgi:uncharacterized membrane protein SirB2